MTYPKIKINGEEWQVLSESNLDYSGFARLKAEGYVRELELDVLDGVYDDYSYLRLDGNGQWWHYFPTHNMSWSVDVDIDGYDAAMEEIEAAEERDE
jgi:hypothetical protein